MSTRLQPTWMLAAVLLVACEPSLGNPPSLVTATRVLAVRGTPPEAAPGATVKFDLLVASPAGTVGSPPADWSFCTAHNPPANNNIVSNACLESSGVTAFGGPAPTASAALPTDGCQLFGPNVPSPPQGQPPLAPVGADVTGGYYQPVRVEFSGLAADGSASFSLERISCGVANSSADIALTFTKTYTMNINPVLSGVSATASGGAPTTVLAPGEVTPVFTVSPGASITFTASWPASSAETFPVYDATTYMLVTQRESLRLSWFASGGAFADDITGVSGTDTDTSTSDVWTAPSGAGVVHFWAVLRDSRGGMDFGAFDVTVGQ